MENIEKVISWGGPSFSGGIYGCPHCGTMVFIPSPALLDFLPSASYYIYEIKKSVRTRLYTVRI